MTQPLFRGKYRVESIRLPNWNYGANGYYFVTICTRDRLHFFCTVSTGEMQLSAIGKIAHQFWADIPNHFAHTYIDAYVIMPNHVHGIVIIDRPFNGDRPTENNDGYPAENVETLHCNVSTGNASRTQREFMSQISPAAGSLGIIVRSYKSIVTRWCHQNGFDDFGWQPRYYEHIIRTDGSLQRIQKYIINNPTKWARDRQNLANL